MELIKKDNLPVKVNQKVVERVNASLAEVEEKTLAFDRNNSMTTLSLMSLTMLNGQSPFRMMRQIMAEIEKRKMALNESQVTYAKNLEKIQKLEGNDDLVSQAKVRQLKTSTVLMESKINGAYKDIATLLDAYENIKKANGIEDWDEEAFEKEENRHHVRRGFELLYRNLMQGGGAHDSTLEYLQQYGLHPQIALLEVSGYIQYTADRIGKGNTNIHANDLEEFLDQMADKYQDNVKGTTERIFGVEDIINKEYFSSST